MAMLPPLYWGELLRLKRSDALTDTQREALQALMDDYQARVNDQTMVAEVVRLRREVNDLDKSLHAEFVSGEWVPPYPEVMKETR